MRGEPQWRKRRCRRCRRIKLRSRFKDGWAQRCLACSRCTVCEAWVPYGRKTCGGECESIARDRAVRKAVASRVAKWREPTRRVCTLCNVSKPLNEDHFHVQRLDPINGKVLYRYMCRPCKRAYVRDQYATNPKRRADARRRAHEHTERIKVRMAEDAEFAAERKQRQREWKANRRRGQPDARRVDDGSPQRRASQPIPYVPAGPLGQALERIVIREQARRSRGSETGEEIGQAREMICAMLGTSSRSLYAWSRGERAMVSFSTADKVLTAAGLHWWDVWDPAEYPKVAERLEA